MNVYRKIKWRFRYVKEEAKKQNILIVIYRLLPRFLRSESIYNKLTNRQILKALDSDANLREVIGYEKQKDGLCLFDFKTMQVFYPQNDSLLFLFDQYAEVVYPHLKNKNLSEDSFNGLISGFDKLPYEYAGVVLAAGDVVIDAGTNIGTFTIHAAHVVGSNGHIHSFEPLPKARELLNKNLDINAVKDNVKVVPKALGEEPGTVTFSLSPNKASVSSFFTSSKREKLILDVISLDAYVAENKLERVDFIKVDIEGMEREFLAGAKETIKKCKPKISITTYHRPGDKEYIERTLKEWVPEYQLHSGEEKTFFWV